MKEITKQWLDKAKVDIDAAERLIDDKNFENLIAFFSQQAIEKSFKAIMEEYEIEVIKIHNLMRLYKIIKKHIDFDFDEDILDKINLVYSDSRYPSLIGAMPNGNPSKEKAKVYYEFAKDIFNKILLMLKSEL